MTEYSMEDTGTVQDNIDCAENAEVTQENTDVAEGVATVAPSPAKSLLVIGWLLAAVLLVFSLYQQPVLVAISTVMQKFFS